VDELYNNKVLLVVSSEVPPHELFSVNGTQEEPILDLEQLQFEGAVEGEEWRILQQCSCEAWLVCAQGATCASVYHMATAVSYCAILAPLAVSHPFLRCAGRRSSFLSWCTCPPFKYAQ